MQCNHDNPPPYPNWIWSCSKCGQQFTNKLNTNEESIKKTVNKNKKIGFRYSTRNIQLTNTLWERMNMTHLIGTIADDQYTDKDYQELAELYLEMKPLFKKVHKIIDKRHAQRTEKHIMELVAKAKGIVLD